MKKIKYFLFALVLLISSISFGQKETYTVNEEKEIKLFNDFKNYLITNTNLKADFNDSNHLEYMIQKFFFINIKTASSTRGQINLNELPPEKMAYLKKSINNLLNYIMNSKNEKVAEYITAIPIRMSKDTFIFNRLTSFQKENSLVFFDKRNPDKTIGYLLFIPPIKGIIAETKIWSWKLGFMFGKFFFTSLDGEEGYEYMFSDK